MGRGVSHCTQPGPSLSGPAQPGFFLLTSCPAPVVLSRHLLGHYPLQAGEAPPALSPAEAQLQPVASRTARANRLQPVSYQAAGILLFKPDAECKCSVNSDASGFWFLSMKNSLGPRAVAHPWWEWRSPAEPQAPWQGNLSLRTAHRPRATPRPAYLDVPLSPACGKHRENEKGKTTAVCWVVSLTAERTGQQGSGSLAAAAQTPNLLGLTFKLRRKWGGLGVTLQSGSPGNVGQSAGRMAPPLDRTASAGLAAVWARVDQTPGSRYVPLATPQAKSTGQMKRMFFPNKTNDHFKE